MRKCVTETQKLGFKESKDFMDVLAITGVLDERSILDMIQMKSSIKY